MVVLDRRRPAGIILPKLDEEHAVPLMAVAA
jgi:hypothetical protein